MSDDLKPQAATPETMTPSVSRMSSHAGSGDRRSPMLKSPSVPATRIPSSLLATKSVPARTASLANFPSLVASAPLQPLEHRPSSSQGSVQTSRPGTRPGTAVTYASRAGTSDSRTRPGTGLVSRPGTSGTIFNMGHIRPDVMCMEANCCAALGNAACRDELMDRLGKFECVWFAIIHLLEHGTYWAQGHAARTLGNLITSPENLKIFAKIDASNTAAQSV